MTPHPSTEPLDSIRTGIDAADRQLLHEILSHSRRMQETLRGLREAGPACDLPSVIEVLTIQQFGYPRTYNLNDGMGVDSAC